MSIKRETLAEQTYTQLRNDILFGKYFPGEKLLLRDLVADLGVSVTPLREAINRLVQDSFMEYSTNQGVRVIDLNLEDVKKLLVLRNLYDQHAIQCIMAENERTAVIRQLQTVVDRQWNFLENPDRRVTSEEITYNFHSILSIETKNLWLIEAAAKCNNLLHLADQRWKMKEYPKEAIYEHQSIIDAIQSGTCKEALEALQAHVEGEKPIFVL